eukprot:CAMPEP_0201255000 /NCGR_PEP_ID=MMETSP0852-20130820/68250_2 /ASSEMBLY_ACC=CAM_ASM_000632 /TAXON_ID=183588 /ORGANISM="Pseudo-nitzschia fraudulenta, Strain WWA7" /LENGTH=60 /DNA_ID=CAMNT_0047554821 /DNA_START=1640 /DNA_END=1819 /DNA_ORIENTATION=-
MPRLTSRPQLLYLMAVMGFTISALVDPARVPAKKLAKAGWRCTVADASELCAAAAAAVVV